jgi:hypothetical protein
MKILSLISALSLLLFCCQSADSVEPIQGQGLPGTWLLYEVGYSPGAGYVTDKIPAQPAQTLTFTTEGQMQVQGERLRGYQSFTNYRLDTVNTRVQLHYLPVIDSNFTYELAQIRNDTLRLSNPGCIEGCHSAFVRIK